MQNRKIIKTIKSFTKLKKYCNRNNLPRPLKTTASDAYTVQYGGKNHLVYKV